MKYILTITLALSLASHSHAMQTGFIDDSSTEDEEKTMTVKQARRELDRANQLLDKEELAITQDNFMVPADKESELAAIRIARSGLKMQGAAVNILAAVEKLNNTVEIDQRCFQMNDDDDDDFVVVSEIKQ